jgi:hypothetical protein
MYRLLQMPMPGQPGERLLLSTKVFDNFYVCLNAALEADMLTGQNFNDDCFADDRRTSDLRTSWRNLFHFKKDVFSWYHRSPWQEQPERVEIWLEKNTIRSLVEDITNDLDVMLRTSSGFFSRTFLYNIANQINLNKNLITWIFYVGDFDPSGLDIERAAREMLFAFLQKLGWTQQECETQIRWQRLAITEKDWREAPENSRIDLKVGDKRTPAFTEKFGNYGLEVEYLEAREEGSLAERLDAEIRKHIDWDKWNASKAIEAAEQIDLKGQGRREEDQ